MLPCGSCSTTSEPSPVIVHPTYPSARYELTSVLGEGRWGIVHRVRLPDRSFAAMKSDKMPVRLSDGDTERDVLQQIMGLNFVGPQLIDSFAIPTDSGNGRRYTVMSLVGPSIKQHMSTNHIARLHQRTASSIMLQVIDAAAQLRTVGFLHNDIHYDNVAFATPSSIDRTLLIDFGNAKQFVAVTMPESVPQEFGVERVLNDFVLREYPDTDVAWFRWAVSQTSNDQHILDFINKRSWRPLSKIYIRNARIVERMANGLTYSNIPLSDSIDELISQVVVPADRDVDVNWFVWALQQEDHHIDRYLDAWRDRFDESRRRVITATRSLFRYTTEDQLARKDFGRLVKCYLQMIGCARDTTAEVADMWFWSLMQGKRDQIAAAFTCHSETAFRALDLAWDVMHGSPANLALLRGIFEDHLVQNGHPYAGVVIY